MMEWLSAHPEAEANFHCVELDPHAIAYARLLNQDFIARITMERQNVLRFRPTQQYDLIWAAGLFDYFSEKAFCLVLRRLLPAIRSGGELVIGNFTERLGCRGYMEFGGWKLNYRTQDDLFRLARECGVAAGAIQIGAEPEGVNLFLHVKRDD